MQNTKTNLRITDVQHGVERLFDQYYDFGNQLDVTRPVNLSQFSAQINHTINEFMHRHQLDIKTIPLLTAICKNGIVFGYHDRINELNLLTAQFNQVLDDQTSTIWMQMETSKIQATAKLYKLIK